MVAQEKRDIEGRALKLATELTQVSRFGAWSATGGWTNEVATDTPVPHIDAPWRSSGQGFVLRCTSCPTSGVLLFCFTHVRLCLLAAVQAL